MDGALHGVVPPVVTPFGSDGEIDEELFRAELRYHREAGVHGVSVAGSTGEGNALSTGEHERVFELAVDEVGDDLPVAAGIITTSAREAVAKAEAARRAGADYLQVTPPHYQTPSDDGLVAFFAALGEVGLPILVYDVIEHVDVDADLLARIADEVPELYGIKQSGGDVHGVANVVHALGDDLCVMSALDDVLYPTYVLGVDGAIAGVNAIVPRVSVDLWEAAGDGDHERARRLHEATLPLARAAVWDYPVNFPGGVKAAIDLLGREPGVARTPMHVPDDDRLERIEAAIEHMRARGVEERP